MTATVNLGKYGDVLSILPLLQHKYRQSGEKQNLVISAQYADAVEGLPEIQPHIWPGHWQDLNGAVRWAKQKFDKVIVTQTYGKDIAIRHTLPSFQLDQWSRAGALGLFDRLPLTFPPRANAKEIVARYLVDRPAILFADQSESSQFEHADRLASLLEKEFPAYQIVRLSNVRLERFTDCLSLYDAAKAIVVTETAHLHLSKATRTPVFALVTDKPERWHGSAWSKHFKFYARYSQYESIEAELIEAIKRELLGAECVKPETYPVGRSNGYNPSLLFWNGRALSTYRYHPKPKQWRTQLVLREHTDGIITEHELTFPEPYTGMSQEDARLFTFNGNLYMSCVLACFPSIALPPCSQAYCELIKDDDRWRVGFINIPKYGRNGFQGQEKNWVFFEHDGALHFIYAMAPGHIVVRLAKNGDVEQVYKSTGPTWPYGEMKGGTSPLPYNGGWLRFFHSLQRHGEKRETWTYSIGACLIEPKPPFKVTAVSKSPILRGNEKYTPECQHQKHSVAICYGAVENLDEHGWTLSLGLNDCECGRLVVAESDLCLQ